MKYIKLTVSRRLGNVETLVNVERIVVIQPHTQRKLKEKYKDCMTLSDVPYDERYENVPKGTLLIFDGTEEGTIIVTEPFSEVKELIYD